MVHNTLSGKKEEFVTLEPGKVKMYVCGVTVYDDIHMGHARSMIVFDMVARYLRYLGYEVTHVTNFTDVDDKIIKRAAERGVEPLQLSAEYIEKYYQDAQNVQTQYSQGNQYSQGKKNGRQQSGVQNDRQIGARERSGCGVGRRTEKLLTVGLVHTQRSFHP